MAKRDDDDIRDDEEAAEIADDAEEAAEEADEAAEEAADAAEDAAEEADVEPAEAEEPPEEPKPPPKAKVTGLTLTLCILNVLAALGFLFLLMLEYEKRQGYAFLGWTHEWFLAGPGTQEDRGAGTTGAVAALPRPVLTNEVLREAAQKRGGVSPGSEPYSQVEGGFQYHLYAGDLTPEVLRELMNDLGDPVGSIEEEMARLKTKLLAEVDGVGAQILTTTEKDSPAAKRLRVLQLLYPLCMNTKQVEILERRVQGTGDKAAQPLAGEKLDKTLQEAVQRRILADILWPAEMFRPTEHIVNEPDRLTLERAADLDLKLDDLRDLMTRRLDAAAKDKHDGSVHFGKEWDGQARGTIEKRQNAAFLLVSIAYARKHLDRNAKFEDQLLFPKGLERAQRISGLFDFTQACIAYNEAVRRLEGRVLDAIALDREGFRIQVNNQTKSSAGFPERHAVLIFQIRQVQTQIRQYEERLKNLQGQLDRQTELVKDRTKLTKDVASRIVEERGITAKKNTELQQLHQQLFRALTSLADAAETNERIDRQIRKLSGVKEALP